LWKLEAVLFVNYSRAWETMMHHSTRASNRDPYAIIHPADSPSVLAKRTPVTVSLGNQSTTGSVNDNVNGWHTVRLLSRWIYAATSSLEPDGLAAGNPLFACLQAM
jgi:hypothetical protein